MYRRRDPSPPLDSSQTRLKNRRCILPIRSRRRSQRRARRREARRSALHRHGARPRLPLVKRAGRRGLGGGVGGGVAGQRLHRPRDQEPLQPRRLLALSSKPITGAGVRRAESCEVLGLFSEGGSGIDKDCGSTGSGEVVGGEDILRLGSPGCDGSLVFGFFTEDEAEESVEAAEGEEEEGSHEGEVVDVVREDSCADSIHS